MTGKTVVSRRRFLALSGAAAFVRTPVLAASTSRIVRTNDPMRIAVIGCGVRGMELLHTLLKCSQVMVVAVCDAHTPASERAQAISGATAYRRWQDVVDLTDIDAVVVVTCQAKAAGKEEYRQHDRSVLHQSVSLWIRPSCAVHGPK